MTDKRGGFKMEEEADDIIFPSHRFETPANQMM